MFTEYHVSRINLNSVYQWRCLINWRKTKKDEGSKGEGEKEICVLPQFALEIIFSTFIHSLTAQSFFEDAKKTQTQLQS